MKKSILIFTLPLFFLFNCSTDTESLSEKNNIESNEKTSKASIVEEPKFSKRELVIRYEKYVQEHEKQAIRDGHGVISYEKCSCSDEKIELWFFNVPDIKSKLGELEADPDLEDVEHQYYMTSTNQIFNNYNGNINDMISKIKPTNSGVTIAVIDTGVDYTYPGFTKPFLYNNHTGNNCIRGVHIPDHTGWDFANSDNDIYDDNGHGTIITHLIYKHLVNKSIDFQIMPIKTFNKKGKSDYFKILCSFIYATNNVDVDVVNMSFGWYYEELSILSTYITENDHVLISTSAGNAGVDTEQELHFPSSYTFDHLVATASLKPTFTGLAPFSNFGSQSIDLAARGSNIPFSLNGSSISVNGTSYSAAITTAKSGELFALGANPVNLKNDVLNSGQSLIGLTDILNPIILTD